MSPSFKTIFDSMMRKTAGPLAKTIASHLAQTIAGAGAGVGVTALEKKVMEDGMGLNVGPVGEHGSLGVNVLTGLSAGNPWLRKQIYHARNPATGLPIGGRAGLHGGKILGGGSLKFTLGGVPVLVDQGIQIAGNVQKATETASQAVGDITENITGTRLGETPEQASARRLLGRLFDPEPTAYVAPSNRSSISKEQAALDKALPQYLARPENAERKGEILRKFELLKDKIPGIIRMDIEGRDIGNMVSTAGKAVGDVGSAASNVLKGSDVLGSLDKRFEELSLKLQPLSDLAKEVPSMMKGTRDDLKTTAIGVGGGVLAAGGLYAAYNLLRDKLNYNRIERERLARAEEKRREREGTPKLAGKGVGSSLAGALLGGGLAGTNAYYTEGDPALNVISTLFGAVSGGMVGNRIHSGIQNRKHNIAGKLNPGDVGYMPPEWGKTTSMGAGSLMLDATMNPAISALKGVRREQNARIQDRVDAKNNLEKADQYSTGDILRGVGGGAIGLAGILALYQAARAAKRIGDGEPIVKADTTVYGGGAGGPENPNVGGKIRVTLPTRKPGDNETVVELPLENVPMSNAILNNIRRDTKRRLRLEGSSRTLTQDGTNTPGRLKEIMAV